MTFIYNDDTDITIDIGKSSSITEVLSSFISFLKVAGFSDVEVQKAINALGTPTTNPAPWFTPVEGPLPYDPNRTDPVLCTPNMPLYKHIPQPSSYCSNCQRVTEDKQAEYSSIYQRCCNDCRMPKPRLGDIVC